MIFIFRTLRMSEFKSKTLEGSFVSVLMSILRDEFFGSDIFRRGPPQMITRTTIYFTVGLRRGQKLRDDRGRPQLAAVAILHGLRGHLLPERPAHRRQRPTAEGE